MNQDPFTPGTAIFRAHYRNGRLVVETGFVAARHGETCAVTLGPTRAVYRPVGDTHYARTVENADGTESSGSERFPAACPGGWKVTESEAAKYSLTAVAAVPLPLLRAVSRLGQDHQNAIASRDNSAGKRNWTAKPLRRSEGQDGPNQKEQGGLCLPQRFAKEAPAC